MAKAATPSLDLVLDIEEIFALSSVPDHPLSRKLADQVRHHTRAGPLGQNSSSLEIDIRETSVALYDVMIGPPVTPELRRFPRRDRRSVALKDRAEQAIDLFCDLVHRYSPK